MILPTVYMVGFKGFDMVVWDVEQPDSQTLQLTYLSKDGEEGYPGNLQVSMNYKLTDKNEFIITHQAQTDKKRSSTSPIIPSSTCTVQAIGYQ